MPHLEWFPVARKGGTVEDAPPGGTAVPPAPAEAPAPERQAKPVEDQPELFPPGPLHGVTVRPAKLELAIGDRKELAATAVDEHGRTITEGLRFEWRASGALSLAASGGRASVEGLRASATESVELIAAQGERERRCVVPVRVVSELRRRADAGIPQPEEVNEPLQPWRSRLVDERWQLNTGHPDYRAFANEPRPRLRYLAMLLSKEIVSRNFPQPGVGAILEELVGLLAALERSGAWGRARDEP